MRNVHSRVLSNSTYLFRLIAGIIAILCIMFTGTILEAKDEKNIKLQNDTGTETPSTIT
jgi:hypothetical protein